MVYVGGAEAMGRAAGREGKGRTKRMEFIVVVACVLSSPQRLSMERLQHPRFGSRIVRTDLHSVEVFLLSLPWSDHS